ncbi:hypothetical protein FQN54_006518 [Arachnomyces sp. PD_36]|nr:hypothetical protein FQN54_006518 [Arachnomyces sp. PD_36]
MPFKIRERDRQKERDTESPEQEREREREPKRERDRDRDSTSTLNTPTKTREKKVRDRDSAKDKDKDRDRDRHHRSSHGTRKGSTSTSTTKSKGKDQERNRDRERERDARDKPTGSRSSLASTSSSSRNKRRASMPGSDTVTGRSSAAASFLESRTSLPYPSFSKAHSKEAVGSREQFPQKLSILTPDPTDLEDAEKEKRAGNTTTRNGNGRSRNNNDAPPSPPLTSMEQPSPRRGDTPDKSSKTSEEKSKSREGKTKVRVRPASTKSSSSTRKKGPEERTKTSSRTARPSTPVKAKSQDEPQRTSSHKTSSKSKLHDDDTELSQKRSSRSTRPASPAQSSVTVTEAPAESAVDSDSTSIAPNQPTSYQTPTAPPENMYSNNHQSSPPTPTAYDPASRRQTPQQVYMGNGGTTSHGSFPPPPPPAPQMPVTIPRVDYLLQNGGLGHHITRHLLGAAEPNSLNQTLQPQAAVMRLFAPYNKLLDDYNQVMSRNGSLAVATGYRSVARRLLDRLEAVFARDISSETCRCVMCDPNEYVDECPAGVSWGEVLELVSGRQELPNWPPFSIAASPQGLGISSASPNLPMQKLDIDIPEEYREHYERQSRKTKQAVDKWLSRQPDEETSPPDEVDEETLTFAILTHLDHEQRPMFSALLGIDSMPSAPSEEKLTPEPLQLAGIAIQRLYRLTSPPRDSEAAIFMVSNPAIHNVLATVAAISNDEWDILVSGRFDGFLRSGAEDHFPPTTCASAPPRSASRNTNHSGFPSRAPTPSYVNGRPFRPASQPYGGSAVPSRAPTPGGSLGAPIAMDEEAEIAALAEVERDIYLGMEALEDAFEALHCKAEMVRQLLRERGAGLTIANQSRRASLGGVEARLGTPGSVDGNGPSWESSTDDGFDDGMSELAPDDSASNISSNRKRRPKRRNERRTTPALVEEDEEEYLNENSARVQRGSQRRR